MTGAPLVVAIFGPTASGKTAVAEALAARIAAEIVSADSMQLYRGLPILTNQADPPPRLTAIWELEHEASVAEYAQLAHAVIDEILDAGRTPVIAGGTGLYLRAALAELDVPPAPRAGARQRLERLYDRVGPERAHAALAARDPAAAAVVHRNDRRRVVRALELTEAGASLVPRANRLWTAETRHPTLVVGLDVPKDVLSERIRERTLAMFDRGVEAEVRRAVKQSLSQTAAKVIGLREVADLPREQALDAVRLKTEQYAAYQRKWMRRIPGIVTIDGNRPPADVADDIAAHILDRTDTPASPFPGGGARVAP